MTELVGYQERTEWMGTEIVTLADIWPERPRAVIIGLNPAQTSVNAGHYYQGKAGQGQLRRLASTGLFALPRGRHFEDTAIAAGVGFTDIVKRPTKGEDGVTRAEIAYGSELLAKKLSSHAIELIVCVFRHPVKALLSSEGTPGMQAERTPWGAQVFRMPGPYDKRGNVEQTMSELRSVLDAP